MHADWSDRRGYGLELAISRQQLQAQIPGYLPHVIAEGKANHLDNGNEESAKGGSASMKAQGAPQRLEYRHPDF